MSSINDDLDWDMLRVERWRHSSTSADSPTERDYYRQLLFENDRLKEIDEVYNKMRYYSRGMVEAGNPFILKSSTIEDPPEEKEDEREFMFDPKDLDI